MGQAFDRDGNLLGEAEGETRREVLERLEKKHRDAAFILIQERMTDIERRTPLTDREVDTLLVRLPISDSAKTERIRALFVAASLKAETED